MPAARAALLVGFALFCGRAATLRADGAPAAGAGDSTPASRAPTSDATSDEENGEERSYPSLPGAVRKLPEWLKKNAPFDVARHFVIVLPEENAAPLYLEALYEFAPREMEPCVSPEEHAARGPELMERAVRTSKLHTQGAANAVERAEFLAEYQGAFEKLAEAQKRKLCVFETGLGIDTGLPLVAASRAVVRLLERRVELHIDHGAIDRALDDVEMALRLGRDLRPRGPILCQLVSMALDSVSASSLIPKVLAAPRLTSDHCDRLLQILIRHLAESRNPLTEGFRTEYLVIRDLLHRLEIKEPLGDLVGTPGTSNGIVLARWYWNGPSTKSLEVADQIDELLARMTARDFASEVELLNEYFRPLVEKENIPVPDANRQLPEHLRGGGRTKLLALLNGRLVPVGTFPDESKTDFFQFTINAIDACRRHLTRLGATECLVALRSWQIKQGKQPPPDLLTICKAAGMKAVPVDYYSETREPLRLTTTGADSIVYSVATDGKDDQAALDWNWGKTKGDWIFRLPLVPAN